MSALFTIQIRQAVLFRAEDPNNLHQVLPQRVTNSTVERIQGFRYPAPGSRIGARVPVVDSADKVYDINQYVRDPRNLNRNVYFRYSTLVRFLF